MLYCLKIEVTNTEPASPSSASQSTGIINSSISLTSAPNIEPDPLPCTSRNIDQNSTLINDETSSLEDLDSTVEEDNLNYQADVQSFENDESAEKCSFCQKVKKNVKGDKYTVKIQEEKNSVDDTFLAYHNICNLNNFAKYQRKMNLPPTNNWATKRDVHKIARERLINYIPQEIITNRRPMSLAHLKYCYAEFVTEYYEQANLEATTFSNQALKDYIKTQLKHQISLVNISNQQFLISSEIDIETIDDEEINDILFEQEVKDFALKYRKNISKLKRKPRTDFIDSEVLNEGENDASTEVQRNSSINVRDLAGRRKRSFGNSHLKIYRMRSNVIQNFGVIV
ncbi:hypothetical protein KQX54_013729 [Cotesia glomerata]|uniref:Uncharacterized protein n=1 Tax=Cotesia glomerata TaxID=32391 RepID=A0AAV7HVE4_COTGL|nr:hypothetical protein KQX54_013729 [Cotesia glomerata]